MDYIEIKKIQTAIKTLTNAMCENNLKIEVDGCPSSDDDFQKWEYHCKISDDNDEILFEDTWID